MIRSLCRGLRRKGVHGPQPALPRRRLSPEMETQSQENLSSEPADRALVIHGPVKLRSGSRRWHRHLFLFSDLLLVSNARYRKCFKIKHKIPLSALWLAEPVGGERGDQAHAGKCLLLGWPTVNYVATFPSSQQREKWRSSLQKYVSLAKEEEDPKSVLVDIFTEDMPNAACPITLTVTNSETANDVIDKSLQVLGAAGSARDYQLWVPSGEGRARDPLIGHECPYGIKMGHLRATSFLPWRLRTSMTPSGIQRPKPEHPSPDPQGHFILKPRPAARAREPDSSEQNAAQKRGSFLRRLFRRGSRTSRDHRGTTPPAPKTGRLFGATLSAVCDRDNLPAPILQMLSCVHQKGPLSQGIFRKSANIHSCRALKGKLDSGDTVDWEGESVLVVASVLKDFLRHVPESVLSSHLYGEWLGVVDGGSDEEKVAVVQRLLGKLPRANVLLLRHLCAALHSIQRRSSTNLMTAHNLAVCIAPSLLWPPASCSSQLDNDFNQRISLVRFLIENCLRIFGEEIASLVGETSLGCEDTKASAGKTQEPLESKLLRVVAFYHTARGQTKDKAHTWHAPQPHLQRPVHCLQSERRIVLKLD